MNEIKCPHCGEVFTIDEAQYENIAQQVRTAEFEKELHRRLAEAEKTKQAEIKLVETETAAKKDAEIERLKTELKAKKDAQELAVTKAVGKVEKELNDIKNKLVIEQSEFKTKEASLKESHAQQLHLKDEMIERLKDMKAKMSVKLLGESLEQHCEIEFNRLRSTAFPRATFGKDNDASGGTKGDFIFRDFSDDGVEYISIMFEMKNEADVTATKKKNSDFFAKLDKDRNAKGCEYAVLVSMLEEDSDLYAGITDVSHEYPKMFVIRPQFFIPMISLLRNAAQATINVRAELEHTRQQNIDITKFEDELTAFQSAFDFNVKNYKARFNDAIDEIDEAIKRLEKVKEALRLSGTHLDRANNRVDGLSIKKLTRNNPTMKAKFAELESKNKEIGE